MKSSWHGTKKKSNEQRRKSSVEVVCKAKDDNELKIKPERKCNTENKE